MAALEALSLRTYSELRVDGPGLLRGAEGCRERGRELRMEEAALRCGGWGRGGSGILL